MNKVELALDMAKQFHAGQFRNDGVTPYVAHPIYVASLMSNDLERQVALLHDLLEDTHATIWTIIHAGFDPKVVDAVIAITKVTGIEYKAYLTRVKADPIARRVKIMDMLANLNDSPSENQIKKYSSGLLYLLTE